MCLEVPTYEKQCEWGVIDQTGLAFVYFDEPVREASIDKTQFYFWLPGYEKQHLQTGTELSAVVDDSVYSWKFNGTHFNYSGDGSDTRRLSIAHKLVN